MAQGRGNCKTSVEKTLTGQTLHFSGTALRIQRNLVLQ